MKRAIYDKCPICNNDIIQVKHRDWEFFPDNISFLNNAVIKINNCFVLSSKTEYVCSKLYSVIPVIFEINQNMLNIYLVSEYSLNMLISIDRNFKKDMSVDQLINKLKIMMVFK